MNKKKSILWIGAGGAVLAIGVATVMFVLSFGRDSRPTSGDSSNNSTQSVEPMVPSKNETAEALKAEAQKALGEQKFDEAREKYKKAQALYEAGDNQVYASDIDMQLDLIDQQEEVYNKIKEKNDSEPPLPTPTG